MRKKAEARRAVGRSAARAAESELDPFLLQHMSPASAIADRPEGRVCVRINEGESPLVWLGRRKMISPEQLQAGERLRVEFTHAQLMPRVTSSWDFSLPRARRSAGASAADLSDLVVGARQRVRHALEAVGPEFGGLLLDVCCFLKRLDDVERERRWPARSAKVVLQLGLGRLARHYGFAGEARGAADPELRTWLAPDASFSVDAV
jgi:hypothetical protein